MNAKDTHINFCQEDIHLNSLIIFFWRGAGYFFFSLPHSEFLYVFDWITQSKTTDLSADASHLCMWPFSHRCWTYNFP